MNILFVSAILPYPLFSGGQVRIYNLLKQVSKKNDITLLSFIRDESERKYVDKLGFCKKVICINRGRAWQLKYIASSIFGKYSFLLSTYENQMMRQAIKKELLEKKYTLIHLEPFYVWPSIPETTIPLIVSEHNIEYEVYSEYIKQKVFSALLRIDIQKLERWEKRVWRDAQEVTAVSEYDAKVIGSYLGHDAHLVPNGVDLHEFSYIAPKQRQPFRLLFVGNFRWVPNVEACETLVKKIWPQIKNNIASSQLIVVGNGASSTLKTHIRNAHGELREGVGSIQNLYHESQVLVAPHTIAGGTKFKMLEAMASGLPIITTPEGMHGIDAQAGSHYIAASSSNAFVEQIVKLYKNYPDIEQMTHRARGLIESTYSWEKIASTLEKVWKKYEKKF